MLMLQNPHPDLRAYFIWGPFLKNDSVTQAQAGAARFAAPNSIHFWTPTPRISDELRAVLKMPLGRLAWDVYLLYGKGPVWDKTIPAPAYWQHQLVNVLQGEPLQIDAMEQRVQKLLE
jgi:hypothetical protein